jgi:3-oxoacyl-[acyl-carrier protein] reductase
VPQRPIFFADLPESLLNKIFDVNIKSIYFGAAACWESMKERGGGVIINTTSVAARRPRANLTAYAVSKAAGTHLTKALAAELAQFKIRVNAVAPVTAETPMLPEFLGEVTPESLQVHIDSVPLGRLCTVDDVAKAMLFLASDEASFITGDELLVDGGRAI